MGKIFLTVAELDELNQRINRNLGVDQWEKSGADRQRFMSLITEELRDLPLLNAVQCKTRSEYGSFESRRKTFQKLSEQRKEELFAQILAAGLGTDGKDLIPVLAPYLLDYSARTLNVRGIMVSISLVEFFVFIEGLAQSAPESDRKTALKYLQAAEFKPSQFEKFPEAQEKLKGLLPFLKQQFENDESECHLVAANVMRIIYYYQKYFPEFFADMGEVYVKSLDPERFDDRLLEFNLFALKEMSQSLKELLPPELKQTIARKIMAIATGSFGEDDPFQEDIRSALKAFASYDAEAAKFLAENK